MGKHVKACAKLHGVEWQPSPVYVAKRAKQQVKPPAAVDAVAETAPLPLVSKAALETLQLPLPKCRQHRELEALALMIVGDHVNATELVRAVLQPYAELAVVALRLGGQ